MQSLKTFCLLITVPDQILSGRHQQPFVQFHPDQREVPATYAKNQRNQQKIRKVSKKSAHRPHYFFLGFACALSFMY
jgi:hypothetical protein